MIIIIIIIIVIIIVIIIIVWRASGSRWYVKRCHFEWCDKKAATMRIKLDLNAANDGV